MRLYACYLKGKFIRTSLTAFVLLTLLPVSGLCQVSMTAAQFLLITPDARGKSLGEGGSVFSRGAISAYYNPALLVTSEEFSGEYNFGQYIPEIAGDLVPKNIYLSSNYRDLIYLGLGYTRFNYGTQERVDELGNSLDTFESYDYALGFWTAISFDPDNSVGVGIKYIKSHLAEVAAGSESGKGSASALALDFGILSRNHLSETTWRNDNINYPDLHRLFRPERYEGFSFGISIANLGEDMEYIDPDNPDPLPRLLRIGFGYQVIDSEPVGMQLSIDATKLLVGETDLVWSYGLETEFYYLAVLRIGGFYDHHGWARYNTIGFGVGPEWLRLDYSRILGEFDYDWNRKAGEYSLSFRCNISSEILKRF